MKRYEKKKLLLCSPHEYAISYEINPWMDVKNGSHRTRAIDQWSSLLSAIIKSDGFFDVIEPQDGLPDMVFAANAGLPIRQTKTFILSRFKHKERQGEESYWDDYFFEEGWEVRCVDSPFEGAGDVLSLNNHLICGYGFRTDKEAYSEMLGYLNSAPILVELKDPRFYHLDTCFCPLGDSDYLYYAGAFDATTLDKFKALAGEGIEVPEEEATQFACNAVCIGRNVILPEGCPQTETTLRKRGYIPHAVPMTEYIKSGGACKCLTLEI